MNKSASVLRDINTITGATYDEATGQILLIGKADNSPSALPKMDIDDLAVAFAAVQQGSFPVVSIEDPIVSSPPEWPGRECFTVRYGPFFTDPADGQRKVLDLSSNTHFGWVMFEADRHMKCLGLGVDNRDTSIPISSSVTGYKNSLDLLFLYQSSLPSNFKTRFWFNPKTIEIVPSADGKSMELNKAEMQLSTETMWSSEGQLESTPDAEYFTNWFTDNYDAIANEQVTLDHLGQPHYIFKELKQLAAIVGVVKWIQDNNIPVDLSSLKNYSPEFFPAAMAYTPQTIVTETRSNFTWTVTGGVTYCNDLNISTDGNPSALAAGAANSRPDENSLAWSFSQGAQAYNVNAVSVDRQEKDGGYTRADVDAHLAVQGAMPLVLGRYFDSFDVGRTMFGQGWAAQPYALQFEGQPTGFNLCGQSWNGYAEVWFNNRAAQQVLKFVATGIYNKTADPLLIASRFDPARDILVYRYQTKNATGQLFTDSKTRYTMRLDGGELLDFDLGGNLTRIQDRNNNALAYTYDASKRLASIGQAGGRTITFSYDAQNRVASAALPDGHSVTYLYDAGSNLASAQVDAPTGRKLQYAYNASHEITEVRDEAGNAVETRTFDAYGRVSRTDQPGVAVPVTQSFNLGNRTSSSSGPGDFSQSTEFNGNYDPTKITDARNNSTHLTYNRFRDVITERTIDGRTYKYYYDTAGRRIATVNPNGRADLTNFDFNGNPVSKYHGPSDAAFLEKFDSDHVRLGSTAFGFYTVDIRNFTYDAKGNLTTITDRMGHQKTFGYDANGDRTFARDGRGKQTDFTYDGFSRLTRVKNALNHQVDFTYDERDNLKRVTTPLTLAAGGVESNYNLKNERTQVITGDTGARHMTAYAYNVRGQIASVTDPAGFVTAYTYDARGNLTHVTHNNILRFTYEYDGLNRLTATRYTGTLGGGQEEILPLSPLGGTRLLGAITLSWAKFGDWTGNELVTIQYSTDGTNWTTIAIVDSALGSYVWHSGILNSPTVRIRYLRTGDPSFVTAVTSQFAVENGRLFYVNDASTTGDQYCTAPGSALGTGLTPSDPADSVKRIIDTYGGVQLGDTIFIDTGYYPLTESIRVSGLQQGTLVKPVRITGPTNGGAAILAYQNATVGSRCLDVSGSAAVIIENLEVTGANSGIYLESASNCTVRYNRSYNNGVTGAPGQDGSGTGISVKSGSANTIEGNVCFGNGGNGGDGNTPSMNGGWGIGTGILIEDSSSNKARQNECFGNGATGGAAGSAAARPGVSVAYGIRVRRVTGTPSSNEIIDNRLYNNVALGRDELQAPGGEAQCFPIRFSSSSFCKVERNQIFGNESYGGRSWDGAGGGAGGRAFTECISGTDSSFATIEKNRIYSNLAVGNHGGRDADDLIGTGLVAGIRLGNCSYADLTNNVCFENEAKTWRTVGTEPRGTVFSYGIFTASSPNCDILNNTVVDNGWNAFSPAGGTGLLYVQAAGARVEGNQSIVRNNAFDATHAVSSAIYIIGPDVSSVSVNANNYFIRGAASVGRWQNSFFTSLADWRGILGQDDRSLTGNPMYYSRSEYDFHLSSQSPLIDFGDTPARVEIDADGEARPVDGNRDNIVKQDIGYDEFVDFDGDGLADAIERTVTHTNSEEVDSDFDGLPDGWEVANGLDPNSADGENGGSGDPDSDGATNRQEYATGSNPRSASSVAPAPPVISAFTPAGSDLFILEQDSLAFSATATDTNNDPIAYTWRLDGVLQSTASSWTLVTNYESSGATTLVKTYDVQLSVTAGPDTVTRNWSVAVNNRNRAPVLNQMVNITANAADTITLTPAYDDPDNQNGVSGDDNVLSVQYTGFMTGPTKVLSAADSGLQSVTVTVLDNGLPTLTSARTINVLVILDTDRDGIPDEVETANGFNPNNALDAALDADGDGMSNLKEYLAATNARDPSSVFKISAISRSGNNVLVSFTSSSSKRYRVERTSDVTSGPWTTVADNVQGTGAVMQVTDANAITADRSFYRAVVLP